MDQNTKNFNCPQYMDTFLIDRIVTKVKWKGFHNSIYPSLKYSDLVSYLITVYKLVYYVDIISNNSMDLSIIPSTALHMPTKLCYSMPSDRAHSCTSKTAYNHRPLRWQDD